MKKLIVLVLALGSISCKDHIEADLIVYNAKIYPMDTAFSLEEAMAVRDGRVLSLGSSDYIRRTYRAKKSIDLDGQFVYPGFNDAHSHFLGYALGLNQVNLVGTKSYEEVLQKTRNFQDKNPQKFIQGRGWDQNDWRDKRFPTKERLDALFPKTPVMLKRIDGHAALVNQAALDFAQITDSTKVEGGILQKRNGKLTGILIDNAVDLVEFPKPSAAEILEAALKAQDSLFVKGLTTITDAGLKKHELHILDSLYENKDLKIRLFAMVSDDSASVGYYLKNDPIRRDNFNVGAVKLYVDGALGSRGALLLQAYSDSKDETGLLLNSVSHFKNRMEEAKAAGWQIAAHAIGDSANRLVLQLFEEAVLEDDHRWRIEHAQIVHQQDVARFGALGVIPSVQPTHATSDMYWAEKRLGKSRMGRAYPYEDLRESAVYLPLGTDFPVEDIDPLKTFAAAVFRQDAKGFPEGGFTPDQVISREDALRGMTVWPAYASFEDEEKGSLLAGMLADFVVLNVDLMSAGREEIQEAEVIRVFLGGKEVLTAN